MAEAVADALIRVEAYRKARQRKRDATTREMTAHWNQVALAIARKTGKTVRVDTATRTCPRAELSADCEANNSATTA